MDVVETARGPVPASELGQTLMHEHVFTLDQELELNYPHLWDDDAREERAVEQLNAAYSRGVRTIVDLTVLGLGRDIERLLRVARRVELNIIVATGLYTFNDLPLAFRRFQPQAKDSGVDVLEELFVRDLTQGIGESGVKAAMLKCATDEPGVTPGVERVLRAVAGAHRATGAPISTHTDASRRRGLEQQAVFREEGVDLERVVIGHSGDTEDLHYLRSLADAGSYLGMDRFGLDHRLPFEARVATVAALCAEGYAERMVLSHDSVCFTCNFQARDQGHLLPRWNITHVHDDVVPALRAQGVTDQQVEQMLVHNPQKILSGR